MSQMHSYITPTRSLAGHQTGIVVVSPQSHAHARAHAVGRPGGGGGGHGIARTAAAARDLVSGEALRRRADPAAIGGKVVRPGRPDGALLIIPAPVIAPPAAVVADRVGERHEGGIVVMASVDPADEEVRDLHGAVVAVDAAQAARDLPAAVCGMAREGVRRKDARRGTVKEGSQ